MCGPPSTGTTTSSGSTSFRPPTAWRVSRCSTTWASSCRSPVVVTAAIVGFGKDDRVLELIEYPEADVTIGPSGRPSVTRVGLTHVGMVCDDLGATRALLESRGVEFLTTGIAEVAGLKTTWCHDPWGTVIILMEKGTTANPYWAQWMPSD